VNGYSGGTGEVAFMLSRDQMAGQASQAEPTKAPFSNGSRLGPEFRVNSLERGTSEHNKWEFRAPYEVLTNEEVFNALYNSSCYYGRVNY